MLQQNIEDIQIPKDLLHNVDNEYIKEAIASILYKNGRMSSKGACTFLNISRRDFEGDVLGKFGFTTYDDTEEDSNIELNF